MALYSVKTGRDGQRLNKVKSLLWLKILHKTSQSDITCPYELCHSENRDIISHSNKPLYKKNPVKNWHTDILVIEDNYHTTLAYLNTMPSLNGSRVSTNSSSASPPSVIIWYISFNLLVMCEKPCAKGTIGHGNEYPTMHYFGIPRHTQLMIAYNFTF